MFPVTRMRRLRRTPQLRALVNETKLDLDTLIYPIFVEEEIEEEVPVAALPGVSRIPEKKLDEHVRTLYREGIRAILLFGVSKHKDDTGSDSLREDGLLARMIRTAKNAAPEMLVISDNCFCEYTTHGHCGVFHHDHLDNDATIENLGLQAVVCARAGADIVAPSAMMDGQIQAIRSALDAHGYHQVPIMAYSAKFASSFYGPFREAAGSTLKGDRKTYQMDIANRREALRESFADEQEGADFLMVKPAGTSLDIIADIEAQTTLPIAAYQVSGEYAAIKFAARAGALDEQSAMIESLTVIKRAGASIIITYFARDVARLLKPQG